MYSIVMMAAMTATPESPDFFKKNQGYGCYGGCYGDPYAGGYGCGGYGNKCCGFLGLCKGQGYGYGDPYGGCGGYGGGNKCCLCNFLGFCKGHGNGCYGDGYGCAGYGDPYGGGYGGGHKCCLFGWLGKFKKGGGCYGDPYAGGMGYGPPAGPEGFAYGAPMGYGNAYAAAPQAAPAQVVVNVPTDAKVYANGQLTDLAGAQRVFATPAITAGQDFRYVIQVEQDGKTSSKEIVVRAGHQTVVDFNERAASNVTVALPEKAKLTVDGVATPVNGGKASFVTPELTKGEKYTYQFEVEVEKDGKVEVVTQKVRFKAGEAVTVDFTETATVSAK